MNAIHKLNTSLMLVLVLSLGMVGSNQVNAADRAVTGQPLFSDVKSHWAIDTITWAKSKKIVDGYPDGTFKPDLQVSEAEFLSMFVKGFGISLEPDTTHWAQPIYSYVLQMNYPVRGATDISLRSARINRLQVAEIITGANGVHFSGNQAIQYILGNKLSNGKKSATISGYAGSDNLTRAEAIQFIKNLLDMGMTQLLPRPVGASDSKLLPELPADIANLPTEIAAVYTKLQAVMNNYPGYSVVAKVDHIGIAKDGNTFETTTFTPAKLKGQVSITHLFSDQSGLSIKLTVELLKAQGLELKDDAATTIKRALDSGERIEIKAGAVEILIAPSPELKDNVDFFYVNTY